MVTKWLPKIAAPRVVERCSFLLSVSHFQAFLVDLVFRLPYTEDIKIKTSLNNGWTFKSFDDLKVDDIDYLNEDWDYVVSHMDDDAREEVHSELAPCSELDFLKRYLEIAQEDLIIG